VVVYNTATMAVIGTPLDLGNATGSLLAPEWEISGAGALWQGNYGANNIRRVIVTGSSVAFDTNPITTLSMPKVEWVAISRSSGATLFAVGSSTTSGDDVWAYFSMTTGVRFDHLTAPGGPPRKAIVLSSDVYNYMTETSPGPNQLRALQGGTMFCQASAADQPRTLEYCQVNIYGGS
jgi:hypothetical protein